MHPPLHLLHLSSHPSHPVSSCHMSAKPSTSPPDKDELWTTVRNILEPLFTIPDEALRVDLVHSVTAAQYSAAYTAAHQWVGLGVLYPGRNQHTSEEFQPYPLLDKLLEYRCQMLGAQLKSLSGEKLLRGYYQLSQNFIRRAAIAARMIAPLDQYVWPNARSTGHGWLPCPHPKSEISPSQLPDGSWSQEPIPEINPRQDWFDSMSDHEHDALSSTWEMPEGSPIGGEEWKKAVQRAEAGHVTAEGVFIKIYALALRRWRIDVLDPLLDGSLSCERLMDLVHNDILDKSDVGLLLRSMKDVDVRVDDERRMRLQELHTRLCNSA
jgi:hypothetical protein